MKSPTSVELLIIKYFKIRVGKEFSESDIKSFAESLDRNNTGVEALIIQNAFYR